MTNFSCPVAEDEYVVLHVVRRGLATKTSTCAGFDIFRVDENGKIVEHWDVLQVVPSTSANDNTMF